MSATSRVFWTRQLTNWHWISAAISLLGLFGFAVTGFTLNHAANISARPLVHEATASLPAEPLAELAAQQNQGLGPLPPHVSAWLDQVFNVSTATREVQWSPSEAYLTLTRPGGYARISIDRRSGKTTYEDSWRGWIAFFNDLHKGRNTGPYWSGFIDVLSGACVVFSLTGLGLLCLKARGRRATWPLIGLGILVPLLLIILLLH